MFVTQSFVRTLYGCRRYSSFFRSH